MSKDLKSIKGKFSERELIAGIAGKSSKIDRADALHVLLHSKSKKKLQIAKEAIEDKKQPYKVRLTAIHELALQPTKENKAVLRNQLTSKDDRILAKTIRVLGEVGDEEDLKELQKVRVNSSSFVAQKLNFAKKLIAYKTRSDKETLSLPKSKSLIKVNARQAQNFSLSPLHKRRVAQAIAPANGKLKGLELAEKLVTELRCGNEEMALAFTKGFVTKKGLQSLQSKKAIPLVMLKKRGCPEEYAVSHYFFATPGKSKDAVELTGVKPSGVVTFTGTLTESKEGFNISMRSVQNMYEAGIEFEAVVNHEEQYFVPSKAISARKIDFEKNARKTPSLAKSEV